MTRKYEASNIESKDGLLGVRAHPDMYLGYPTDDNTIMSHRQLVKELIDNVSDEAMELYPAEITMHLHFAISKNGRYQLVCSDNARGIPLSKVYDCMCKLHTSGKHKGSYNVSTGTHGVGGACVAGMSKIMATFSVRDGKISYVKTTNAVVGDSEILKYPQTTQPTGTLVFYEVSPEVFSFPNQGVELLACMRKFMDYVNAMNCNLSCTISVSHNLLSLKLFNELDPISLYEMLKSWQANVVYSKPEYNKSAYLLEYFKVDKTKALLTTPPLVKQIADGGLTGCCVELFVPDGFNRPHIVGSVNGTPIDNLTSSHISVVLDAIRGKLSEYVSDSNTKGFVSTKYVPPLTGFIQGYAHESIVKFVGQNKTEFRVSKYTNEAGPAMRRCVDEVNPEIWEDLYFLLEEDITAQYAKFSRKTLTTSAGLVGINAALARPSAYRPCRSKDSDVIELLIGEGSSASVQIAACRDGNTQAVYELKGKVLNLFKNDVGKNEVVLDLITILGVVPADTTLDKFNFSRIGILTDSDLIYRSPNEQLLGAELC